MSATPQADKSQLAQLGTLTNTIIECSDLERCASFYTEQLGLPVRVRGDGWLVADGGAGVVVLYQGDDPRVIVGFTGADLEAARALVAARGGDPGPIVPHPTGHHFTIDDPEGNRVMVSD